MIRFDHVSKHYPGNVVAVDNLSLEIADGETLVLLGTSGCGKTTTLKMINRLIEPTRGCIYVNDIDILHRDPIQVRRKIGYAIQEIGLFPHMTVFENVSVAPKIMKWPREKVAERFRELLRMVGLDPANYKNRYPRELSGGERQRVGVARALAADPPIILMDEPFGALDPITREQLQNEFVDLLAGLSKTIIFVTHDIFEAVKLADRIALLDGGRLQQLATPVKLVEQPANEFVDTFLGRHRFQLSLLTKSIKAVMGKPHVTARSDGTKPQTCLRTNDSLVEALDLFKKTGSETLPVYESEQLVGCLAKNKLVKLIARMLGDSEGDT